MNDCVVFRESEKVFRDAHLHIVCRCLLLEVIVWEFAEQKHKFLHEFNLFIMFDWIRAFLQMLSVLSKVSDIVIQS